MIEIWKTIIGFDGYFISNLGEVKSFKHDKINGKILRLRKGKEGGYFSVALRKDNKTRSTYIHRLVAQHFLDDWSPTLVVDHIDEDKLNNRYDNLRMCTLGENNNYYRKNHKHEYTSEYFGVSWNTKRKKWYVFKRENNKQKFIGSFKNEEEAHNAYLEGTKI